ncbi:MAG: glycoside hydrolase family 127 protein [Kiritimatiellae bacterium]|nr:glycoside hydrolase family 127 protein [Kiritimatiellia bacterium]
MKIKLGVILFSLVASHFVLADYPIKQVAITDVKLNKGFWFSRLETNRIVTLKACFDKCNETPRIANITNCAIRAKGGLFKGVFFDDSDVFKVMEGAAYIYATTKDKKIKEYMDWLIDQVSKAQEIDGYLYTARTLGGSKHIDGTARWECLDWSHELYNQGHMYEAAVAWYEATGETNFLDVAKKSADLLCRTFGYENNKLQMTSGHQEVELALCRLYKATGEKRYLNLAHFFLDVRGKSKNSSELVFDQEGHLVKGEELDAPGSYNQKHLPVCMQREAVGHAVRAVYMYSAMTDIAAFLADKNYLRAVNELWNNVVSKKLHLNGSVGARMKGEAFGAAYNLPNEKAYLETCAGIGNALWNARLFLLTGDVKYMDVLERVLYNGIISSVSLKGDEFFYPNPLASGGGYKREKWFSCSCCPVNIVRFLPQIPTFAYAYDGNGTVFVNLYMDSFAIVDGAKIKVETDYPWSGKIKVTVEPEGEKKEKLTLKLRVPGWARGRPVPSDLYKQVSISSFDNENGYIVREFLRSEGVTIELDFPMEVKRIQAHSLVKADLGRLAVERGPIVFSAEGFDNEGKAYNLRLPKDVTFEEKSVMIGENTFPALKASNGVKLIPYFAWGHREKGNQMQSWFKIK